MAHGMLRGAVGAWMGLIVLQALTQKNGADAVGGLIGTVDTVVKHVLDPAYPAIPDHTKYDPNKIPDKTPVNGPDGKPNGGYINGDGQYIPPTDSTTPQPQPAPGEPGSVHQDLYRIPGITA